MHRRRQWLDEGGLWARNDPVSVLPRLIHPNAERQTIHRLAGIQNNGNDENSNNPSGNPS